MISLRPSSESLLAHSSVQPLTLTPVQSQVDGLVGSFTQQATDWKSLAAMMAGGMAYRMGRIGIMTVGVQNFEPLRRIASVGIGLGAEVTAFEMANRSLSSLTGETQSNPNLWRWEGQGGIRQGLLSSLITFGSLKGAGRLAQGENVVVQHLLQDTGMVLGHQVSASFGIIDRPQGSLAEQFLHAEATNLQLSAGMTLAHSVAPGIQGLERGLDLSIRSNDVGAPSPRPDEETLSLQGQPALAIVTSASLHTSELLPSHRMEILKMEGESSPMETPPSGEGPTIRPTFDYPPEIESAWSHVEESFAKPGYYEGSREELAAKRPDPDAVDMIRSHQAEDYGRRVPGARVEILDAEALLDPPGDGGFSTQREILQQALSSLGVRGREGSSARRLVRIYLPRDFLSNHGGGTDDKDLLHLSLPPGFPETEKFLRRQVRLGVKGEMETRLDIVSLSLLEALYQTVLGRNRAQFHYVPGTIPRDRVMSLRARRASPVGLSRGLIFLGDVQFEVDPFSFTAHDAEFHGGLDAIQPDPFPELGGWLYSGLARRMPAGDFRETMLDHLSDSNFGGENGGGLDSLSRAVLSPLRLFVKGHYKDPEIDRRAKEEDLKTVDIFRSLILEEGPGQPHLAGKEYFFLQPLDEISHHIRETQAIAAEFQTSGLWPPPSYDFEMLEGWRKIKTVLDHPDYLAGSREVLRKRRPPEDLIDALFHFQGQDYGRRLPETRVSSEDMEVFFDPSPTLDRALTLLGDRGEIDSPARQVLEIEMPLELYFSGAASEVYNPQKKYFAFFLLHETNRLLRGAVQLIHQEEEKIRLLIPSLSLTEKLLQAEYGEENSQFHYVHGTPLRDKVMGLRGRRTSLIGLSLIPIHLGDIDEVTHPFNLPLHDIFHAAHDASRLRLFPEMSLRFYNFLSTRSLSESGLEYSLDKFADLENEIFQEERLTPWGRSLMGFLGEAFDRSLLMTDIQERRREIGEIEALSAFLHRWVKSQWPAPDRRKEEDMIPLREFFDLRRRIHEDFRLSRTRRGGRGGE